MGWKSTARSAIGVSHKRQGLPCQDYGSYIILDNVIAGAVSDGAGSARRSEIGAECAVISALDFMRTRRLVKSTNNNLCLQSHLNYLAKLFRPEQIQIHPPQSTLNEVSQRFFKDLTHAVIEALHRKAEELNIEFSDLACTLIVFLATPEWVIAMQIGDGFLVVRQHQKTDYKLLFQPDRGEFVNETTFVTSSNALQEMQTNVFLHSCDFLCASTDGLDRLALRISDWTPYPPFFKPLEEFLNETPDPEKEDNYITSFLSSDRLNAKTDDDKTLLICLNVPQL